MVINAIRALLRGKCAVTATTGKAAFNINGVTIHSLLILPVGPRGNKDLLGQTLVRLQESLEQIDYIIIDEYSILGQINFGWIDRRLKQAFDYHDKLLGNKILDSAVKLDVNQRVQGNNPEQTQFRELLLRLRKGESTLDNWKLLLTRQPASVENLTEFNDATRLFYSKEEEPIAQTMQDILLLLPKRLALMISQDFNHSYF